MLQATAEHMPSFDKTRRRLLAHHVVLPRGQGRTRFGLIQAIITMTLRDLREAITIREMARQTPAHVPAEIDVRVALRFHLVAWWVQPRGEAETLSVWHARV